MVGLVIVSHSYKLAEGVKELAEQMGKGQVKIVAAGGIDETTIGTDLGSILRGIEDAYGPEGVLLLMDLGSAVLTTRMAVDMLPDEWRPHVRLSQAPIVEGAIAAAAEAASGSSLAKVDEAACSVLQFRKIETETIAADDLSVETEAHKPDELIVEVQCSVRNPLGLHARSAGLVVQEAQKHQAAIEITNLSRRTAPANARSLINLLRIGAAQGHQVSIKAVGTDASAAVTAVVGLFLSGFGELEMDSGREINEMPTQKLG